MTDNPPTTEPELVERARIAARRRIVFETPHGCNNDLADDLFDRTWKAALAAIDREAMLEAERERTIERCAERARRRVRWVLKGVEGREKVAARVAEAVLSLRSLPPVDGGEGL